MPPVVLRVAATFASNHVAKVIVLVRMPSVRVKVAIVPAKAPIVRVRMLVVAKVATARIQCLTARVRKANAAKVAIGRRPKANASKRLAC